MSLIIAMCIFSFVMSITPGPVNFIIFSSSFNVGFNKTFGFISGSTIGFTLLLASIAIGLNQLVPSVLMTGFNIGGMLFLIYLGYKIINSNASLSAQKNMPLVTFKSGFILQWLNPKAWAACLSGVALFSASTTTLWSFIGLYFIICYGCLSLWGILAQVARKYDILNSNISLLNRFMGGLLILMSIYLGYQNFLE